MQDTAPQLSQLASQLAMHAAGMHTQHVSADSVPPAVLEMVRQDFATQTQALMPDKPAAVLSKIVDGKVSKWLKEVRAAVRGSHAGPGIAATVCDSLVFIPNEL